MNLNAVLAKADRMRELLCEMCLISDSGHPTSSLSCTDLIATLYFSKMNFQDPARPSATDDVFILSKGHAAPALYAAFIVAGILEPEMIKRLRLIDSPLQGHPDVLRLPAVGASTGALGQGLSMAIGRALAMQAKKDGRTAYCIVGDGESQEGQIWEAALFGGNRSLPNLIAFTDHNKGQSDGSLKDVMPLGNLASKWNAFGWNVLEVDGHAIPDIQKAIEKAKSKGDVRPTMIIAHTEKGYIAPGYSVLAGDHSGKITADLLMQIRSRLKEAGAR